MFRYETGQSREKKAFIIWIIYKLLILVFACGLVFVIWFVISKLGTAKIHIDEYGRFLYPLDTLPHGDYSKLNNLTGFKFSILNQICTYNLQQPWVVILVVSSTDHFKRRQLIRTTWGRQVNGIKVAFVLGLPTNSYIQARIQEESASRHDIIQGTFQDTYRNLSYKHIMLLKFVTYHCQQAKYIVKMDDDSFISTGGLLELINHIPKNITSNLLICRKVINEKVIRDPKRKWFVSKEDFDKDIYPPYCMDFGFIYSGDVVFRLYAKAQVADMFSISDIFVTGFLVLGTNIEQIDLLEGYELRGRRRKPCDLLFGDINLSSGDIITLYEKDQRAKRPCVNPLHSWKLEGKLLAHALRHGG